MFARYVPNFCLNILYHINSGPKIQIFVRVPHVTTLRLKQMVTGKNRSIKGTSLVKNNPCLERNIFCNFFKVQFYMRHQGQIGAKWRLASWYGNKIFSQYHTNRHLASKWYRQYVEEKKQNRISLWMDLLHGRHALSCWSITMISTYCLQ